jgi:hypothetical protein
MKLTSKQFAWLFLVKNGNFGLTRGYYGGWEAHHTYKGTVVGYYQPGVMERHNDTARGVIAKTGVDWEKSQAPRSDKRSEFNGTDAESSYTEILKGELVLKDGTTQYWESEALKVEDAFALMEAVQNSADEFDEYFGKKAIAKAVGKRMERGQAKTT